MILSSRIGATCFLVLIGVAVSSEALVVSIPDANLESIVRLTLGPYYYEPPYPPIDDVAMAALVSLYASNKDIADLTGLEYAINATSLTLDGNQIADLAPIAGLTKLKWLKIRQNPIDNISVVSGLVNLELLWIGESPITDLYPIAGLTNMTNLGLVNLEHLYGIEFVSGMNKLTKIAVRDCPNFYDLTPLQYLPALKELDLETNAIRVLTPLYYNTDLSHNRATVRIGNNPICQFSACYEAADLVSRGVILYGVPVCKGAIEFEDPDLEAAVGGEVGITGRQIYTDEVVGVGFTSFQCSLVPLSGLGGLDSCTDLTELTLSSDGITVVMPLHALTKLTRLTLDGNLINDVQALRFLTELTYLNLNANALSSVSGLDELPKLEELSADNNQFTSLNRFSGLVHLKHLNLANNQIVISAQYDGEVLANLTQLHNLDLRNNQIANLSALVGSELGDGDEVYLQGNPLSHTALTVQIPALEARGVIVHYDGQPPDLPIAFADPELEALVRTAIGKPTGDLYDDDVVGVEFRYLDAASANISALGGLEHCKDLWTLILSGNQIQDLSPLAALNRLEDLSLEHNDIADLTPLSGLTSLTKLMLGSNSIVDCSPLSGLTGLLELDLSANAVMDIASLSDLVQLRRLSLSTNEVVDIDALGTLVNLTALDAGDNSIEDIAALASLAKLEDVILDNNQIDDLTPLTSLLKLQWLRLAGNQFSEIVALCNNPGLSGDTDYIDLKGNPLSEYALCTGVTELENRDVLVEYDGACAGEGEGEDTGGCMGGALDGEGGDRSGNLLILAFTSVMLLLLAPRSRERKRQSPDAGPVQ